MGENFAATAQLTHAGVSARTLEIVRHRRSSGALRRRGWLIRRALLGADVAGLALAFWTAQVLVGVEQFHVLRQGIYFVLFVPVWIVAAKLHGLYDRDEERTDHSTAEDLLGVFHLMTAAIWLFFAVAHLTHLTGPDLGKLIVFWALGITLIALARIFARTLCRRSLTYLQNTLIIGADETAQLIARKLLQHPEYGINLVGFVDNEMPELREDLRHVAVLEPAERLRDYIELYDVDRVIVSFAQEPGEELLAQLRSLTELSVQIDLVPRLHELVGPNAAIHTVEALPLIGLPPVRMSPSSRAVKRAIDFTIALVALICVSPLFLFIAWRVKRTSPGPIFFRQTRLGMNMREFVTLKFRTMKVETSQDEHREFIQAISVSGAIPGSNGIFKLDRSDSVTTFGRWLRKTSLDELPQLVNVLRGEMSLVGPRPCIPYEVENFEHHHFERFLVPQGITGLWQVMARAHSTFTEALDMDVAYARGWSLGLDIRLMFRTPIQLLRGWGTA